jgi:hypothetical protein
MFQSAMPRLRPTMNLNELIAALEAKRDYLESHRGLNADEVQAVVWNGDDTVPVTDLDYDRFEVDGPWVVEIRKASDP